MTPPESRAPSDLLRRGYWRLRHPRRRHRRRGWRSAVRTAAGWRIRRRSRDVVVGLVDHIGDVIAAEPIVRHLRRKRPDARIGWVIRRELRELVEHHPDVDFVVPVACLTEWIHLRRWRVFPDVVDLHVHGRVCDRCWLPVERDDPAVTLANYYRHGSLLQVFCRAGGLPPLDDTPRLTIPTPVVSRVRQLRLPREYVAVHARSNQRERDWTDEKWGRLAAMLERNSGLPVVEIGSQSVLPGNEQRDLCGRLSLLESAEVIRRASLFVGIDSGPAHMANAVGTPGVVLLGAYAGFDRYTPYSGDYGNGSGAELVRATDGPAAMISVDEAHDAVARRLSRHRIGNRLPEGAVP